MTETLVVSLLRGKRVTKRFSSGGALLADELAANVKLVRQLGNGLGPGQRLQPDLKPLAGRQGLGCAVIGNCLLQRKYGGRRMAHVCFLLETGEVCEYPPVWGKQTI